MAAKSLGTPRIIESSVVPRQTRGSNHIWKTSSGKSDLKSHLTVSQRLGARDKEGIRLLEKRVYSHRPLMALSRRPFGPPPIGSLRRKFMSDHQRGGGKRG